MELYNLEECQTTSEYYYNLSDFCYKMKLIIFSSILIKSLYALRKYNPLIILTSELIVKM